MESTVDQPAAEREPDPREYAPAIDWSAYEACWSCWAQVGTPCLVLAGYEAQTPHPDRALKPVELPDTDIRQALAADLDRMGLMPEPLHYRESAKPLTGCDIDANVTDVRSTDDRAQVTCAACAGKLVEPERRTVSLECLTDELRNPPLDPDVDPTKTVWIPPHARVGIVLRADGQLLAVVETDADWIKRHGPVALLMRLLQQAEHYARDGGAELLMPTPDVLAALDGRPDAQLLTAPVHVLAMDVKAGMLLRATDDDGDGAETLELVTAERDCDDPECIHGTSCVVLTVSGHEDPDVHFGGFGRIEVRIPVSVTR